MVGVNGDGDCGLGGCLKRASFGGTLIAIGWVGARWWRGDYRNRGDESLGNCRYCGKSAGFLRKQHKECAERHDRAMGEMRSACVDAALRGAGLAELEGRIRETAAFADIEMREYELREVLEKGWRDALEEAVEDRILSIEEKRCLNRYRAQFCLEEARLDVHGQHFQLFKMMNLLRSLTEDGVLPRFDLSAVREQFGRLPFNMMKSEYLVWVFPDVRYFKEVTRREFRGSSMGASVRVAKGVYVRPGSFKGESVESSSMEYQDSGVLGITTKHIYFKGSGKSFRVRLEKVVSFDPYKDSLHIMRDTASAKPEAFTMGVFDVWFCVNVIDAIMGMDEAVLRKGDGPTIEDIMEDDSGGDAAGMFAAGASL